MALSGEAEACAMHARERKDRESTQRLVQWVQNLGVCPSFLAVPRESNNVLKKVKLKKKVLNSNIFPYRPTLKCNQYSCIKCNKF